MGKGIAILFYLIMLPTTGILLLTWIATYLRWKKHTAFFVLLVIWGLFIFLIGLFWFAEPYFRPMILTQKDIIGNYVIDKDKFPGKQADWQYDNFKFTINENDELIFKSRIYDNVWKSDTVKISYSTGYYDLGKEEYCNRKIRVHSDSTSHHIIKDNPTLYRQSFGQFYYVFKSEKFGNVFFKRGKWTD
ncbi:hypothetical protein [Flavobacterium filum]|jgi:hypothetical protein|uniref:hypothetical protein n=1 Tax=Flavobacterium filum TaxID=370974 RepID=UPI0023F053DB|nr:hypothetical protein [Flavobacterium filum]